MNQKIRFLEPCHGVTEISQENAALILPQLGYIKVIRGVQVKLENDLPLEEYVTFEGEHGYAEFSGYCWAYSGSGPAALIDALQRYSNGKINKELAEHIVFGSIRGNHAGVDWSVELHPIYAPKVYIKGIERQVG